MIEQRLSVLKSRSFFIFFFAIAVMAAPAMITLESYDTNAKNCRDCTSYLNIATDGFDSIPVRRYRIIVPAMASVLNLAKPLWQRLAPKSYQGDFSLPFSFYLVNLFIFGLTAVFIYRYLLTFGLRLISAMLGICVLLTCKWTAFLIGNPLADSLYILVAAILLYGIRSKNTPLLSLTIFVGPFAKESFIFLAPLLFFSHIPKQKLVLYLLLSAVVVFGFHYLYDLFNHNPVEQGLRSNFRHVRRIKRSLIMLINGRALFEIASVIGLWLLPLIYAIFFRSVRAELKTLFTPLHVCFLISVFIHILLSNEYSRMVMIAMPFLCLVNAYCIRFIVQKHIAPSLIDTP